MPRSKPVKICLVGQSLAQGGAERAMGLLSVFLESKGIEVHNVLVLDDIAYPFAGELLNLGKRKGRTNGIFDKASRFLELYRYLRRGKFDCIVDFRIRVSFAQEFLINRILYSAPVYYTVHSAMLHWYFPESRFETRLVYSKAAGVVSVSDGIKSQIETRFGLGNVTTIPNAVDFAFIDQQARTPVDFSPRFMVSAGRMDDDVKQFDELMRAFAKSDLPQKGIALVILGEGKFRKKLRDLADSMPCAEQILLPGFAENPYAWFSKSDFFVLCSKNEGLPMVLIESLACGTPVVSFDCATGPAEIINDGQNGILVRDQDFGALTEAMNKMASDTVFYANCKANAKQSAARFDLEKIGQRWLSYLKIDVS